MRKVANGLSGFSLAAKRSVEAEESALVNPSEPKSDHSSGLRRRPPQEVQVGRGPIGGFHRQELQLYLSSEERELTTRTLLKEVYVRIALSVSRAASRLNPGSR